METWHPERLEQNLVAATLRGADEAMSFMVGFATLGAVTVEAGRRGVGASLDLAPVTVMEFEEEGPEPARPEPLLWPMPQYPKGLGSIALGADGMAYAVDRQFATAA